MLHNYIVNKTYNISFATIFQQHLLTNSKTIRLIRFSIPIEFDLSQIYNLASNTINFWESIKWKYVSISLTRTQGTQTIHGKLKFLAVAYFLDVWKLSNRHDIHAYVLSTSKLFVMNLGFQQLNNFILKRKTFFFFPMQWDSHTFPIHQILVEITLHLLSLYLIVFT